MTKIVAIEIEVKRYRTYQITTSSNDDLNVGMRDREESKDSS